MRVKKTQVMNRNISLYLLSEEELSKLLELEKDLSVMIPSGKRGMVVLNKKSLNLHMILAEDSLNDELIYHELYHLYFYLLDSLNLDIDYVELNKDIYANLFSTLVISIKRLKESMIHHEISI